VSVIEDMEEEVKLEDVLERLDIDNQDQ